MSVATRDQKLKKDILKILELAAKSPSSHNTQPWFVKMNNNELSVGFRTSRHLRVGDPEKRELLISIGCFVETFIRVSEELGYKTTLSSAHIDPNQVIRMTLIKSPKKNNMWTKTVPLRRSDRRLYEKRDLDAKIESDILNMSYGDAKIKLVSDQKGKDFLSDSTYYATKKIMSDQDFRDELSGWVRNNWTRKPDGMPGYSQGMPGLVSLFAKPIVKNLKRVAKDQAKQDAKRVKNSSTVALIYSKKQRPIDWINAGRLYQSVCIHAQLKNIKTSAVSAAVIDKKTAKKIVKEFKLNGDPVALVRLGYKDGITKESPRLTVNNFLKISS